MQTIDDPERLQEFFREHPDALIVASREGHCLHVNDAATSALGGDVRPETLLSERVHPGDYGHFLSEWAALLASGTPSAFTVMFGRKGAKARAFVLHARRASTGDRVHVSLRPKEAESDGELSSVRRREQVLRVVLDNLPILVWATDKDGTCTYADGKGLEFSSIRPEDLIGSNALTLYPPEATTGLRMALEGTMTRHVSDDNGQYWDNRDIPVQDEDGNVIGTVGMSLNITELQQAKAELEAKLALIERQQEVIRNLETPIIQVWDHVLTLPMVGVVDSRRASRVMDDVLGAVNRTSARFAILDLTGVDVIDTATASHLFSIIGAVRLLGAEGIISGIRPNVAQTMVSMGVDLSSVITLSSLRDALALCMRRMRENGRR
ncbi:PAS domain-containing protein [Polyangium jinanense]|uniref:PAS domain-containing protein n=1 Tax=Polyangium jinanense TaxID=2829994 RepID=A0A9X4AQZ7_9BACT|nr:PAS domain-containing protein [Polyangium jinanense]MDC3955292.1 PAS domain-containing protein [Polyangium jinanense]MDC3981593.1 PAS domain-containing protein [Polyangium jinanense]